MENIKELNISIELWGGILCLIAVLCTLLNTSSGKSRRNVMAAMQTFAAALLIFDSLAWYFRGSSTVIGYYMVRISNAAVFILSYAVIAAFSQYVAICAGSSSRAAKTGQFIIRCICFAAVISVIISQFINLYYYFDSENYYHRTSFWIIIQTAGIICTAIDLLIIIRCRKNMSSESFLSLLSYIILPFAAMIVQVFFYGMSFTNIAVAVSMMFMFIANQTELSRNYRTKEAQMHDLQIEAMLSQIGHHFIFNTLSTIKYLCSADPVQAEETIDEFASYLRGTLDSLSANRCIPFEKELDHVRNYLAIEKKRFGKRVNAEYDISDSDFMLPPLTVQPIVENAVKHGICKRAEGGTVKISVRRENNAYTVKISDNGVGFDADGNSFPNDGKTHVGISNVRSRLASMCGGTLQVTSTKGIGTEVIISIPFDRA